MLVRPAVLVIWVGAMCADHIDVSRDDEAEDLLPGPQSAGLEDGWLRHFAIPSGEEHQKVHHFPLQGGNAALGPSRVVNDHYRRFAQSLTLSKKTSLLVNLRTAVSVSCTIPMTGLLDWGVTIIRGTMASSWISALVSRDWGRWRFISSPSKSALYGVVTLVNRQETKLSHGKKQNTL